MKFCNLFLFITDITRSTLQSCIFIKYSSLKHKVVIFAEFLKHVKGLILVKLEANSLQL